MTHLVRTRSALTIAVALLLTVAPAWAQKAQNPTSGTKGTSGTTTQPAMPSGIRIDLNSATRRQLQALPGVSATTAKKIVKGRPYATVDDVLKAGVARATLEKIRPYVGVSAATANPPTAGEKK